MAILIQFWIFRTEAHVRWAQELEALMERAAGGDAAAAFTLGTAFRDGTSVSLDLATAWR